MTLIERINQFLNVFNSTFELETKLNNNNVESISIKNIDNSNKFIQEILDIFGPLISQNDEYKLMYKEGKGLIIAKKITGYVDINTKDNTKND